MENREYTHGGSFLKNIWLLLRSLVNILAFAGVLCFYILKIQGDKTGNTLFPIIAVAFFLLCFLVNLVLPFLHRKK